MEKVSIKQMKKEKSLLDRLIYIIGRIFSTKKKKKKATFKLTSKQIRALDKNELEYLRKHPAYDMMLCYPGTVEHTTIILINDAFNKMFDMGYDAGVQDADMVARRKG